MVKAVTQEAKGFPGDPDYQPEVEIEIPIDKELDDLLAKPPAKGWQPEVGDKVGGTLVDRFMSSEGQWGAYPILEIEMSNGEVVAVHCFHTILRNQVEKKSPQIGDRVAVQRLGTIQVKGVSKGNDPENYKLVVLPRKEPDPF